MISLPDLASAFLNFWKGMSQGVQAFTVQPYTEVNSKRGVQYEVAFFSPSLAAGATQYFLIVTGSKPIAIKDVVFQFNNQFVESTLFKNPTLSSNGTPLVVYNMNDEGAVAGETTVFSGPTVTTVGTQVGPSIVSIGSTTVGNRTVSSVSSGVGVERILSPNSAYLYRVRNTGTNPTALSGVTTWYEGDLDF